MLKISKQAVFVLAIIVLAACTGASESKHPPLKVEWTDWYGDYTMIIAQEKGFFKKHGVEVEPARYKIFSEALPDLTAAKIDGGLFAIGDALAVAGNDSVKAIMVYDSGGTSEVAAVPEIQSVQDLRGKRVGVNIGTYTELFVREMLKSGGLTIGDVTLVNVGPEAIPDKLGKDLEAGYIWEPYTTQAVERGNHVLYGDSENPKVTKIFPDVIVFRSAVTKDRPDDVRAFLAAWSEAVEYRKANPEESNAIIAKVMGYAPEDIVPSGDEIYTLADNRQFFTETTGQVESTIHQLARLNLDFLITTGAVTNPPDLHQLLDPSFLK